MTKSTLLSRRRVMIGATALGLWSGIAHAQAVKAHSGSGEGDEWHSLGNGGPAKPELPVVRAVRKAGGSKFENEVGVLPVDNYVFQVLRLSYAPETGPGLVVQFTPLGTKGGDRVQALLIKTRRWVGSDAWKSDTRYESKVPWADYAALRATVLRNLELDQAAAPAANALDDGETCPAAADSRIQFQSPALSISRWSCGGPPAFDAARTAMLEAVGESLGFPVALS